MRPGATAAAAPLARSQEAPASPPPLGLPGGPPAERARILHVEDSALQAAYVRSVLERAGYEVRCCQDPGLFATELHEFAPDLLVMDLLLPGTSGHELVAWLRRQERYAALPVLFLTSEGEARTRIATIMAGGDDHLVKPVARGLFLAAVRARLERSRRVHELLRLDGLTGLLNRNALLDRAQALVDAQRRKPWQRAAWVMIDLDHFKSVNDRHGHPVGDQVLISAAALLRRNLRRRDTVGRCGGEEFALLLDDLDEAAALRLVEGLRQELAAATHSDGNRGSFRITLSAGIAMLAPAMDLDEWRVAADQALYAAKAAGRNRVVVASPSLLAGRGRRSADRTPVQPMVPAPGG
jgi:diguanylate cyclase (GGDEF)-like protein